MSEHWTIGEIRRRRVPLLILWHEYLVWLQRIEDQTRLFRCCECRKRFNPAPDLCVTCFEPVCGNCYKQHERGHWRPLRTIGGDILKDKNGVPF